MRSGAPNMQGDVHLDDAKCAARLAAADPGRAVPQWRLLSSDNTTAQEMSRLGKAKKRHVVDAFGANTCGAVGIMPPEPAARDNGIQGDPFATYIIGILNLGTRRGLAPVGGLRAA